MQYPIIFMQDIKLKNRVHITLDSIVVSSRDHLLARGSQDKCVLVLCCVRPLDIAEWGIGVYDTVVAEVLEGHQILGLTKPVNPAPAESQGAEILVDDVEKVLGLLKSQGHVANVKVHHVVRALHVLVDHTAASGAERLDRVHFVLFHLNVFSACSRWIKVSGWQQLTKRSPKALFLYATFGDKISILLTF